jgi:Kef-type K+ transport system membrane component KefB
MNIAGGAAVTGTHKNELMLFYTLLELTLIVLAGRLGGLLARRCAQSSAVGEIIVGILLGPSCSACSHRMRSTMFFIPRRRNP